MVDVRGEHGQHVEGHMPVHDQVVELLRQGCSPGAIAKRVGISHADAVQHLFAEVDRGEISRDDLLLAVSEQIAREVESTLNRQRIADRWTLQRVLLERKSDLDIDDALLYYDLREVPLGGVCEAPRPGAVPAPDILQSLIQQGEEIMSRLDVLRNEIDAIKTSVTGVTGSVEGVTTRVKRILEILEAAPTQAEIEAMAADLENNVAKPLLAAKAALDAIAPLAAEPVEPPAVPAEPPLAAPGETAAAAAA